MEKGSTPKSRLTRSAAKQVNSTPTKKIDEEEALHHGNDEDTQHNLSRKSRRKTETKHKTNGDTSTNVNSKKTMNFDSVSESNSVDECESEDSNISAKQRTSPKPTNHKTPPLISRKSLRVRRSITPGPELESSASKKMQRCVSEGKLESVSTPTKRGGRAKSESKDFVFTPSKCKSNGKEMLEAISESSSRYVHRNSTLRVIEKIVEANEEESSQEECGKQSDVKNSPISTVGENVLNDSQTSMKENKTEENPSVSSPKKLEEETDDANIQNRSEEINQRPTTSPLVTNDLSCRDTLENTDHPIESISETANVPVSCDGNNLNNAEHKIQCEDESSTYCNGSVKQPSPNKPNKSLTDEPEKLVQVDSDTSVMDTTKTTGTSETVSVSPVGDPESCVSQKNEAFSEKNEEVSSDSQSDNVSNNNNITVVSDEIESTTVVKYKEITPNSEDNDIVPQSDDVKEDTASISEVKESIATPILDDKVIISDSEDVDNIPQKDEVCKNKDGNVEVEHVIISESDSPEPMELPEEGQCMEDAEKIEISSKEDLNPRHRESCEIQEDCEKTDERHDNNDIPVANLEQRDDNLDEVVIEDSENSQGNDENHTSFLNTEPEDVGTCHVQADPPEFIDHENPIVIEYNMPTNPEVIAKDPLEQETSVLIQETSKLELLDEYGREQFSESNENFTVVKLQDEDKLLEKESTLGLDRQKEFELEEDFNQDNYNKMEDKLEEDSGSNSDIYKDMSDFGSEGDEKKGRSNRDIVFMSSERGSGTGDSEEYLSSDDYEEEEDGEEENAEQKNVPSDNNVQNKKSDESDCKVGEKLFDTTTPMTYDKALAILNKNRVKKIDDEEFFDMFTQELNRVSEESGSDSDIAIVDEYIMDAEEPTKKPNQKSGNPPSSQANVKPAQRPAATNQQVPSLQHFPANYNQQRPPQHIHPSMQRMNLPQSELYNHYGNQAMPHVNAIRGPAMYNQFGPHPSSVPDPRMYHPHGPHDDNFARAGMYNHPMGHIPDAQLHYPSAAGLKVRNANTLNSQLFSDAMNQNYACPEQMTQGLPLEMNALRIENDQEDIERINTETTETVNKLERDSSLDRYRTGETPILDLLGLDNEKLKLLKKALGLQTKPKKAVSKTVSSKKNKFLGKKMAFEKKKPHTDVTKSQKREYKKSLLKRLLSDSTFTDNFFKEFDSSEYSTEGSVSSGYIYPSSSRGKQVHESSTDTSHEDLNRDVSIENDSLSVTVFTRKPRHKFLRRKGLFEKWMVEKNNQIRAEEFKRKSKRKRAKNTSDSNSSSENLEYEINLKRKKMTQGKKQNKKESTVIKSNCGTFTVDPLTGASQSESEAPSDEQSSLPSKYLEQVKRNMKKELASGKNKLSNMFTQHSFQPGGKSSKRKVDEAFEEQEKTGAKKKVRKLKKLPSEVLEQLCNEGGKKKSQKPNDYGSEEEVQKTQKKRWKRSKKMKVKSSMPNQDYIPLVTGGATDFGLSRLDKTAPLASAELAARFRSEQLYGSAVKRITIMDFKG